MQRQDLAHPDRLEKGSVLPQEAGLHAFPEEPTRHHHAEQAALGWRPLHLTKRLENVIIHMAKMTRRQMPTCENKESCCCVPVSEFLIIPPM